MAYDRLAESRKLIADGVPEVTFRLSRRRRFLPLAVDVDGDVAATLFVRRGVSGSPTLEAHTLERRDGTWVPLGGGAGEGQYELFDPRDSIEGLVRHLGGGWTLRGRPSPLPWRQKGISHAEMRLAPEVAALRVGDRRIEVAAHGVAIVVWPARSPEATGAAPTIFALDDRGEPLGSVEPI